MISFGDTVVDDMVSGLDEESSEQQPELEVAEEASSSKDEAAAAAPKGEPICLQSSLRSQTCLVHLPMARREVEFGSEKDRAVSAHLHVCCVAGVSPSWCVYVYICVCV